MGNLHELLLILRVLLDQSETDNEMALFPEVLIVKRVDTQTFPLSEGISNSDIEVLGAKHKPLVDVN